MVTVSRLKRATPLQPSFVPFTTKGSPCTQFLFFFFLCSRQLSASHQQSIYIAGPRCKHMRVSWFKITFRPSDRCLVDCWVAARLRSSSPTPPALFPLARSAVSWDEEVGRSCKWYTRQLERDEKDLPFAVKRRTLRGERLHTLKCHFLRFTTSLSHPPQRPGREMCFYEKWFPLLIWPRADLWRWPLCVL